MKRNIIFLCMSIIIILSMLIGLTVSTAQTPAQPQVVLGEPGLSYRYVQTYGQTQVPYLTDTDHLNRPWGISIDALDNLLVVEEIGQRLLGYDPDGDNFLTIGHPGVPRHAEGYLNFPHDVTRDTSNNLWVITSHGVYTFDPSGNQLAVTPQDPWNSGNDDYHFSNPFGIAFDQNGFFFISDFENHRVQIYSVSGYNLTYVNTIGETSVPGNDDLHFNSPGHIAFDSSNALYVTDALNYRIQKCTSPDNWLSWSCSTFFGGAEGIDPGNGEMSWSIGISIDSEDNVFIADGFNFRVLKCTPAGECIHFVGTAGEPGNDNGHFGFITDVAIDSMGQVYVADKDNMRAQVFAGDGSYVKTIGETEIPYLVDDEHYNQPWGVATASDGGFYIFENSGCRLIKVNPDGSQAWTFGQAENCFGGGDGQFGYGSYWGDNGNPTEVAGKVYMPDFNYNRIQIFDAGTGAFISSFGEGGSGDYQFSGPYSIAVNPTNQDILVADNWNSRVQVFTSDLTYKTTIGETGVPGDDDAHFNRPKGIAVDANGAVYIADSDNYRIQKCNTTDGFAYTCTTLIAGNFDWNITSFDQLHPETVVVDAAGKVYVTTDWFNKLQVYDASGAFLTSIGMTCDDKNSSLCYPQASAVDAQGNVYIADANNYRVQKFAPGVPDWKQVNINGFGSPDVQNVSITPFDGQLYASTWDWSNGTQVWRTANGTTWEPATEQGYFGSGVYYLMSMTEFDGQLYGGVAWSDKPPEILRTSDGTDWTEVMTTTQYNPDGIFAMTVYGNQIYAALADTTGAGLSILRSSTGDAGTWSAVVTGGNGDVANNSILGFAIFNSRLYAIGKNVNSGAFVWQASEDGNTWTQVNTPGFDETIQSQAQSIAVFNGALYVGTFCIPDSVCLANYSEIWKTTNGTDWSQVETPFSNSTYRDVTSLFSFDGALFVVVAGGPGGNTVWRSLDGETWIQVNIDGWGDSNSDWSLWDLAITSFDNQLYVSTTNYGANGAKIWRFEPEVMASFIAMPTVGPVPLEVTFTNTSTGTLTASLWDFGDGITSTLTSPIHTYEATGVYTVSLTVDSFGNMDTITMGDLIVVENRQFFLPVVRR